jgi:uncharacterized protein (TIGR00290 family)
MRHTKHYEVVGLLSTMTEENSRVSMHNTRLELLKMQAQYAELPLHIVSIPENCPNEIYEARIQAMLENAISQDITHIAFGDLFLKNIRHYRESKLANINIKPLFPLWGQNTTYLAHEMIDVGMKAIIICIDSKKLDVSFIGRQFDKNLLQDLPAGIDPCAEHGEFHTFVYGGPMFLKNITLSTGSIIKCDDFILVDIFPAYA